MYVWQQFSYIMATFRGPVLYQFIEGLQARIPHPLIFEQPSRLGYPLTCTSKTFTRKRRTSQHCMQFITG